MALRAAVANGNWSSTSTWNGGVLPSAGDVVASNGFTVTIDQNVNVDSITNTAIVGATAVPIMTGYTTPSGIASSSSLYSASYEPFRAFDGNNSSSHWITANTVTTGWLAYEFSVAKVISSYTISGAVTPTSFPKDWTFEGWNGFAWIVLHTVTGNTNLGFYTATFANSTSYIKYRINITLNNGSGSYIGFGELYLYELNTYVGTTTAGGTFNLNSGVTVTCTGANSINQGANTVLTCNVTTGNTSTLIGNNFVRANVAQPLIVLAGTGTFNVTGAIPSAGGSSLAGIEVTGINSTLNFTGTINSGNGNSAHGINTNVVCTINVVGSTTGGFSSNFAMGVRFNSAGIFTLVGTATGGGYNSNHGVYLNNTTATITGDLYGGNLSGGDSAGVRGDNNANITVTGTMYGRVSPGFLSISNTYLNHYGSIISTGINGGGSQSTVGLSSTGAGAINILTGPFISSSTGIQPLYVARMHYRRTMGSYFEFRDNSTNGALSPAAPAPATRLVSPDTVVAAPIPANVRQGVTYALGSQTGTMIVPDPANVVKNVPVDNTVGTGVLDPSAMWNVPLAYINTSNSIGKRVKNAATVESTGAQIQTTLNNNP
jgi:hypothetical protein